MLSKHNIHQHVSLHKIICSHLNLFNYQIYLEKLTFCRNIYSNLYKCNMDLLYFKCINSLHKSIISITTMFGISIFFNSYLMLWWSLDAIQIKFMLLSFSCFYFLVFQCTKDFCMIFSVRFSLFHFINFTLLISAPPRICFSFFH